MTKILFTVLLFCASPLYSQNTNFEKGLKSYNEFSYSEALSFFEKATKSLKDSESADAYYYIGLIHLNGFASPYDGDEYLVKADNAFMLGANKGSVKCIPFYAASLLNNRNATDSITARTRLTYASNKGNGLAYLILGELCKTYNESIEYYKKALDNGEKPYYHLAYSYYKIKDYNKARLYGEKYVYEQNITISRELFHISSQCSYHDYRDFLYILGDICYKLKDYDSAEQYLNLHYRVNNGHQDGYVFSSRYDDALVCLGDMLKSKNNNKHTEKSLMCYEISAFNHNNKNSYISLGDYYKTMYQQSKLDVCLHLSGGRAIMGLWNYIRNNFNGESYISLNAATENYIKGFCYQNGQEVKQNLELAAKYYKLALDNPSTQILKRYTLYQLGKLSEDKGLAKKYFLASIQEGGVASLKYLCYKDYDMWNEAMKYSRKFGFNDYFIDEINSLPLGDSKTDCLNRAETFCDIYLKGYSFMDIYCYDTPVRKHRYHDFIKNRAKRYWTISNSEIKETNGSEYKIWYINTRSEAVANYYFGGNYSKVWDLLKNINTDKMDAMELACLGLCYYYGKEIKEEDKDRGLKLLNISADRGNEIAMTALGNDCRFRADYENAVSWYKRAAYHGSKEGMRNLALCYNKGLGVERNSTLAAIWMKQAAKLGDKEAKEAIK